MSQQDQREQLPGFADQAESAYVEREDEALDEPEPETVPSGATVRADRADAVRRHQPDRLPTPDEEEAAERAAAQAADVSQPYEEALRRGAEAKGEGRIEP